jgi:ATP-binding protein involved in chromosome partitioning
MTAATRPPTEAEVRAVLAEVYDEEAEEFLESLVDVSGISVSLDGHVRFILEAEPSLANGLESLRRKAHAAIEALPSVSRVTAILTAQVPSDSPAGVTRITKAPAPEPTGASGAAIRRPQRAAGPAFVGKMVAVASAKGGVGKSTIATNLASALARKGLRVGLLDADVYGPSIPTMFGLQSAEPDKSGEKLIPLVAGGLKLMSIGFMVDANAPLIWRGPIVTSAITQLLQDVEWGNRDDPLDVLIIDMPPGTGDAQLTLVQKVALDGAVIVSTPQDVALADVRRGIAMFDRTHCPVLGVIENMAWFEDANGTRIHIFGEGGARRIAGQFGVPFLGEIPLEQRLREDADFGTPHVVAHPDSSMSSRFSFIADGLWENLKGAAKAPPVIRFE